MEQRKLELPNSFMSKVEKTDRCWNWIGQKTNDGYGRRRVNGKKMLAHRIVWMSLHGDIEFGLCVLHKCDNPSCVNPDHLFIGTHQENMDDKNNKGRQTRSIGEKNGSAKLTKNDVDEIRKLYTKGSNLKSEHSLTGLAKKYGVSFAQIYRIVNFISWKEDMKNVQ